LHEFAKEVSSLKFEEEPNYNKLRFLLEKNLLVVDKVPSKYMDWMLAD